MRKKKKPVATVPSAPLFAYLAAEGVTPSEFARKMNSTPQVLTNWKTRGNIPLTALPEVVDVMGITQDGYMLLVQAKTRPPKQATFERTALLSDYDALPDGLREVVARKASELRKFIEALDPIYRDAFRNAPTDPEKNRAWEKEVEAAMEKLKQTQPKVFL